MFFLFFPFHPRLFQGFTGKLRENSQRVLSQTIYIQKDWFSRRTFTPYIQRSHEFFSFIHLQIFFFLLLKDNTKIWLYIQEVGEERASRVSLFQFGNYLFVFLGDFVKSRSNPPVVIVLPSPKWYLTA